MKGDQQIAQDRSYAEYLKMNEDIELQEVKTYNEFQQKREMLQEPDYEALGTEKRRLNLVIMVTEAFEEERKRTVMDLMKELEDAEEVQVFGRIGKAAGKPRSICVKMGNWENRHRVLLKAKQLNDPIGFKNIYVCPVCPKINRRRIKSFEFRPETSR